MAIAKQAGTNAVTIAQEVIRKVESMKGVTIPADVRVTVTRDYGETAEEKANELLWHLLDRRGRGRGLSRNRIGTAPGHRVSLAIPLTLALTLFTSMLIGYTINRVTLVCPYLLYRHSGGRRHRGRRKHLSASDAAMYGLIKKPRSMRWTRSVIRRFLATFTVIAALLPMAFVSGLMGPYMRPIPVNASIAMFFSLLVAFVVIPWFCQTCYRPGVKIAGVEHESDEGGLTARIYRQVLSAAAGSSHPGLCLLLGLSRCCLQDRWCCSTRVTSW